jgi:hypothetical protein
MIAHAGGIDEIILGLGVVLLFLLFRSARADRGDAAPNEGPCLYCGRQLSADDDRCPECGFRAQRGPVTSSASASER